MFIAGTPEWAEKFRAAGVPIVGDDIKSQIGATITHRVLARLFEDRGVVVDRTMQLNVGGNMDFKNMLERDRLESKKVSKTQAVTSNLDHDLGKGNVHIGPERLRGLARRPQVGLRATRGPRVRRRAAEPRVQARGLGQPELRGASSSTRCAAPRSRWTAGSAGPLNSASSYFMKSPPVQVRDETARRHLEDFLAGGEDLQPPA